MELLRSLGIDGTFFIQLGIFLVVYLVMNELALKPYFRALQKRKEQTEGGEALAERFVDETSELQHQYETKAKLINKDYKEIYDKTRSQAMHEYDEKIEKARAQASQALEESRTEIHRLKEEAKSSLKSEVRPLAQTISDQVLGKQSL